MTIVKRRIIGTGGMFAQNNCGLQEINVTYVNVKDTIERSNLITLKVKQAKDQYNKLTDKMEIIVPQKYQQDLTTFPYSKLLSWR